MADHQRSPRALVLGGTGHVGRAVVTALAQRDIPTTFTYHEGQEAALGLGEACPRARGHRVDLRQPGALSDFIAALDDPPPQLFIHCAGTGRWSGLGDIGPGQLQEVLAVSVQAALEGAQALAPRLAGASLPGAFVFVTPITGARGIPAPAHLAAAQGGLQAMARALARELGPQRIRVNAVMLGLLDGGISAGLDPELVSLYTRFNALGRLGTAREAAELITWIALEDRWATGTVVSATGGI